MACLYPIPATRRTAQTSANGETTKIVSVALWPRGREREENPLTIPCGKCSECRDQDKLGWALRCSLEAPRHKASTFATLTYDGGNVPRELELADLQGFYKRLRRHLDRQNKKLPPEQHRKVRHFSCGEYGGENGRPHYHALLFGIHAKEDRELIKKAWGMGRTDTEPISIATIHYVVGYTDKKRSEFPEMYEHYRGAYERLDRETGEVTAGTHINYMQQPPFRVMSKRPGIGAAGKEYRDSWRTHAVLEGRTIAVPRFLKNHWLKTATEEEKERRDEEITNRTHARITDAHATWEEAIDERERHAKAVEEIARSRIAASRARRKI